MTEVESTKQKILNISTELFADKGFARTSVREIASLSEVNIAAINYHFGSKQNLYIQVFANAYQTTESSLEKISKSSKTIEDLAVKYFDHLTQGHVLLKSLFRIILSNESDDIFEFLQKEREEGSYREGPPGIKFFVDFLKKDHQDHQNIEFAAKTIMANVTHFALIYSSAKCHIKKKKDSYFSQKNLRDKIKLHAQILNNHSFD